MNSELINSLESLNSKQLSLIRMMIRPSNNLLNMLLCLGCLITKKEIIEWKDVQQLLQNVPLFKEKLLQIVKGESRAENLTLFTQYKNKIISLEDDGINGEIIKLLQKLKCMIDQLEEIIKNQQAKEEKVKLESEQLKTEPNTTTNEINNKLKQFFFPKSKQIKRKNPSCCNLSLQNDSQLQIKNLKDQINSNSKQILQFKQKSNQLKWKVEKEAKEIQDIQNKKSEFSRLEWSKKHYQSQAMLKEEKEIEDKQCLKNKIEQNHIFRKHYKKLTSSENWLDETAQKCYNSFIQSTQEQEINNLKEILTKTESQKSLLENEYQRTMKQLNSYPKKMPFKVLLPVSNYYRDLEY